MLSQEARTRLAVVLVGARNPQNIGAAARAMQDFGFSDLRVVNPFTPPFDAARLEAKSAVGAHAVLESARLFSSLGEAIADCTVVAGTTAVGDRELRQSVFPLREAAPKLLKELASPGSASLAALSDATRAEAAAARVALLFGSEKTGLTREHVSHCGLLLTIPLFAPAGRHLSMNLAQAVAVCLYELTREGLEGARELPASDPPRATAADRERLTCLLLETMQEADYTRRFPANARPEVVRQLVSRLGATRDEAATWMGVFRAALRAIRSAAGARVP